MTILFERIRNLHFPPRHQTLWAFVVILFISIWVLNANPFAGETVGPFDLLLAQPGWGAAQWNNVLNNEASDVIDSQLPVWITLKEQIRSGKGALWYPYANGGKITDFEPYSPPFLLFLIIKDNALAFYMVGLFKLVIAGLGGYLLLKTFLKWAPSMWGGIVFMLCGFNVAWFCMEHVATAMWIPWLLAATVMYLRTGDMKWLPAITLSSLFLILGYFLSVAAFGFYTFGLLVLTWNVYDFFVHYVRAPVKDKKVLRVYAKKTALPLLAVGIGFMLAAIALVPFIDTLTGINLSYRAGSTYGTGTVFGSGTNFTGGVKDLLLLFYYEYPIHIERTAYIGIPAVVLALLGIFGYFRSNDDNYRKFIFFHLLLVVIATLITFGLLPHDFIRALPVFSNNSWGRLVVILLLGLAVLSSVGLDVVIRELPAFLSRYLKIAPLLARRTATLIVIMLIAVQFVSQKIFFNDSVAVVPSSWFYPLTPSIQYVKEHLKPLQSAIADNSFGISGSLGAYGIADWYGHSLRTDREKEVLGNLVTFPFASPTSAFIDTANIVFNSPLMDKMVIKYLLIDKTRALHKTMRSTARSSSDQGPPMPANSWRQRINIENDIAVDAVGFMFSTYGEANAPANLHLKLYKENDGQIPVESELDKRSITDNSWSLFEFSGPVSLSRGAYYLELSLPGYFGPKSLTALGARNMGKGTASDYLEINGQKTDFSLEWQIAYYDKVTSNSFGDKWNLIDLENNIAVLENKQVTNSAYFVKDLDASNNKIDFSGLEVRQPSSDLINISYLKEDPGWIVLPMHLHPGWKAYVDNRQVRYDTYLGILPAIPVSGASHILFKFEPEFFRKGLLLSLIGVLIFLVFSGFCFRKVDRGPSTDSGEIA